ncbi:MAG: NADPH-dependent F420 reductase [Cyanobacteriota bacterium]|jgi:predicted dinucleotide-binding enzyme
MKVGILGSGSVGARLAALARAGGHDVYVGTRSDAEVAAQQAEIFILAIPYLACAEALPQIRTALAGKVVIDATNPLNSDWSPISFADQSSAAEEIAKLIPAARLVKAFNTVFADVMVPGSYCGMGIR